MSEFSDSSESARCTLSFSPGCATGLNCRLDFISSFEGQLSTDPKKKYRTEGTNCLDGTSGWTSSKEGAAHCFDWKNLWTYLWWHVMTKCCGYIYIYTRIWYLHWYAWIYMYNKYTGVYTYRSMCGYMRSSSFSFLQGISNLQRSWGRVSQISRTGFFFLHLFHFRRVWTLPWNTFVKQKNTTSLKLLNPLWNYQQFRLWKYQNCPNIRAISSNPTNPFVSGFFSRRIGFVYPGFVGYF